MAVPNARRNGRKYRRYLRGNLNELKNLGATLAGNTGIRFISSGTVKEKAWLTSVRAAYSMKNYTPVVDAGPIQLWLCHSDLDLAQIEEYIEHAGSTSWDQGDVVGREINSRGRLIKLVGTYVAQADGVPAQLYTINGGRPTTTKLGWQLTTGQGLVMFWYNTGSAALTTTDPEVNVNGHANLWPN